MWIVCEWMLGSDPIYIYRCEMEETIMRNNANARIVTAVAMILTLTAPWPLRADKIGNRIRPGSGSVAQSEKISLEFAQCPLYGQLQNKIRRGKQDFGSAGNLKKAIDERSAFLEHEAIGEIVQGARRAIQSFLAKFNRKECRMGPELVPVHYEFSFIEKQLKDKFSVEIKDPVLRPLHPNCLEAATDAGVTAVLHNELLVSQYNNGRTAYLVAPEKKKYQDEARKQEITRVLLEWFMLKKGLAELSDAPVDFDLSRDSDGYSFSNLIPAADFSFIVVPKARICKDYKMGLLIHWAD